MAVSTQTILVPDWPGGTTPVPSAAWTLSEFLCLSRLGLQLASSSGDVVVLLGGADDTDPLDLSNPNQLWQFIGGAGVAAVTAAIAQIPACKFYALVRMPPPLDAAPATQGLVLEVQGIVGAAPEPSPSGIQTPYLFVESWSSTAMREGTAVHEGVLFFGAQGGPAYVISQTFAFRACCQVGYAIGSGGWSFRLKLYDTTGTYQQDLPLDFGALALTTDLTASFTWLEGALTVPFTVPSGYMLTVEATPVPDAGSGDLPNDLIDVTFMLGNP